MKQLELFPEAILTRRLRMSGEELAQRAGVCSDEYTLRFIGKGIVMTINENTRLRFEWKFPN